jgi:hypothetical protein
MPRTVYVHVESKGAQFPVPVRVHGVIGHRAIAKKLMSEAELDYAMGQICDQMGLPPRPSIPTTRRWAQTEPNLPEAALDSGLITVDGLAPWARPHVARIKMAQGPIARPQRAERSEPSLPNALKGVAAVTLGIIVLRALFGPPGQQRGYR